MPGVKRGWLRHWAGTHGFIKESGVPGPGFFVLPSAFEEAGVVPMRCVAVEFEVEPDPEGRHAARVKWLREA